MEGATTADTAILVSNFQVPAPKAIRAARPWQAGVPFAVIPKGMGVLPVPKKHDLNGLAARAHADDCRDRAARASRVDRDTLGVDVARPRTALLPDIGNVKPGSPGSLVHAQSRMSRPSPAQPACATVTEAQAAAGCHRDDPGRQPSEAVDDRKRRLWSNAMPAAVIRPCGASRAGRPVRASSRAQSVAE